MIYQKLVLDSSTANHPDTVQIICLMFPGAEELLVHLRHRNPEGHRTNTKYDVPFTHKEAFIEELLVAAVERCHGASHMLQCVYQRFD